VEITLWFGVAVLAVLTQLDTEIVEITSLSEAPILLDGFFVNDCSG
jgi:hypothetical protein